MTLRSAVAALCFAATAASAAPTYRITVIPTGNVASVPGPRISDAGVVAGSAHFPGDPWRAMMRAFRWTEAEGLAFSAGIDANSSMRTINLDDAGRVAAEWTKPEWPDRIATWSADGTTVRLARGGLYAGNARGDLLGYELGPTGARSVLWRAEGARWRRLFRRVPRSSR